MKPQKEIEDKQCVVCANVFKPYRPAHITCTPECRRVYARTYAAQIEMTDERKAANAAATKRWRAANPQKVLARAVRQYGITDTQYLLMLAEQGGACAVCRRTCDSGRRLAVDHDHQTGQVRGLLCVRCNQGVGQFRDSPDLLRAAAEYLAAHPKNVQGDGPSAVALHIVKEEPAA